MILGSQFSPCEKLSLFKMAKKILNNTLVVFESNTET